MPQHMHMDDLVYLEVVLQATINTLNVEKETICIMQDTYRDMALEARTLMEKGRRGAQVDKEGDLYWDTIKDIGLLSSLLRRVKVLQHEYAV